MSHLEDVPDFIAETKRLCAELSRRLPQEYRPQPEHSLTTISGRFITSKMPSKLMAVVGALGSRAEDFAEVCHDLFKKERTVPAAVITRALMETTALLYLLHKKLKKSLDEKNIIILDEFLILCMDGSRVDSSKPQAPNILTAIQHLDKEPGCDQYLRFYESLCEFAHPNSLGTIYAYAYFSSMDRSLTFRRNAGLTKTNVIAFSAVFALEIFLEFYDRIISLIPSMTELSKSFLSANPVA